jgi:hypothetical protein
MTPLTGHRIVLLEGMDTDRALVRFLTSLGASLTDSVNEASFALDGVGLDLLGPVELAPNAIHVSVSPFGSGGPRSRWRGGELVASAMGGALRVTGEPDMPPVKEALDACTFHADMVAASGALAAHYARGTHGSGQHVDVSIQQVAFSRNFNGILCWQFDQRKLARVGGALAYGKATVKAIWQLADGWCFHSLMTGRLGATANQGLSDWIDEVGMPNPLQGTDWLSYNRSTLPAETRAIWEAAIAAFSCRAPRSTKSRSKGCGGGSMPALSTNLPMCWLTPTSAARGFFDAEDGLPVPLRQLSRRIGGKRRSGRPHRRSAGPAFRRPRAGFRLGAGRFDHHQDAGRSWGRHRQDRNPHPP